MIRGNLTSNHVTQQQPISSAVFQEAQQMFVEADDEPPYDHDNVLKFPIKGR